MIPTIIRYSAKGTAFGVVVTVLGGGKLEATFHIYDYNKKTGQTHLSYSSGPWSTEAAAISEFEEHWHS